MKIIELDGIHDINESTLISTGICVVSLSNGGSIATNIGVYLLLFLPLERAWFGKAAGTLTWKWFKNLCADTVKLMQKMSTVVYALR